MSDIYLVLGQTAHGKRYWRMVGDPSPSDETLAVYGPATMGSDGYSDEDDAAEAIATLLGIRLDEPSTWDELR